MFEASLAAMQSKVTSFVLLVALGCALSICPSAVTGQITEDHDFRYGRQRLSTFRVTHSANTFSCRSHAFENEIVSTEFIPTDKPSAPSNPRVVTFQTVSHLQSAEDASIVPVASSVQIDKPTELEQFRVCSGLFHDTDSLEEGFARWIIPDNVHVNWLSIENDFLENSALKSYSVNITDNQPTCVAADFGQAFENPIAFSTVAEASGETAPAVLTSWIENLSSSSCQICVSVVFSDSTFPMSVLASVLVYSSTKWPAELTSASQSSGFNSGVTPFRWSHKPYGYVCQSVPFDTKFSAPPYIIASVGFDESRELSEENTPISGWVHSVSEVGFEYCVGNPVGGIEGEDFNAEQLRSKATPSLHWMAFFEGSLHSAESYRKARIVSARLFSHGATTALTDPVHEQEYTKVYFDLLAERAGVSADRFKAISYSVSDHISSTKHYLNYIIIPFPDDKEDETADIAFFAVDNFDAWLKDECTTELCTKFISMGRGEGFNDPNYSMTNSVTMRPSFHRACTYGPVVSVGQCSASSCGWQGSGELIVTHTGMAGIPGFLDSKLNPSCERKITSFPCNHGPCEVKAETTFYSDFNSSGGGFPLWAIIVIILAVVVVGVAIWFSMCRGKYSTKLKLYRIGK